MTLPGLPGYDAWKLQAPDDDWGCDCRKCDCEYGDDCAYSTCTCPCCQDPEEAAADYGDHLHDLRKDEQL